MLLLDTVIVVLAIRITPESKSAEESKYTKLHDEDVMALLEQQQGLNIYCFDGVKHPEKYLCEHF